MTFAAIMSVPPIRTYSGTDSPRMRKARAIAVSGSVRAAIITASLAFVV